MKKSIHPKYNEITVTCSCNTVMRIHSTANEDIHVETCYACHPHYTKKKRELKAGRVEKFKGKYKINLTTKKKSDTA